MIMVMTQRSKFYNKIINNIAKGVKETLNEDIQRFDVTEYKDDSIVDDQTIDNIVIPVKDPDELKKLVAKRIDENPENPYLLDINVSEITDFSYIFAIQTTYSDENCNQYLSTFHSFIIKTEFDTLDIHTWDMSNAKQMSYMFKNSAYKTIILPDNISNVRNLTGLFIGCNKLINVNLSALNTSKTTNMTYMFCECNSLKEIDISHFNVEKVIDMSNLFSECYSLTKVKMFKTETPKLTDISNMFDNCIRLKMIDLSSITTPSLKNIQPLNRGCDSLKHIKLSEELAMLLLGGAGIKVEII